MSKLKANTLLMMKFYSILIIIWNNLGVKELNYDLAPPSPPHQFLSYWSSACSRPGLYLNHPLPMIFILTFHSIPRLSPSPHDTPQFSTVVSNYSRTCKKNKRNKLSCRPNAPTKVTYDCQRLEIGKYIKISVLIYISDRLDSMER